MKKLFTIIITLVVISSCSTTKEAKSTKAEARIQKKAIEQAVVKNAVESKRYIIKFNRLFYTYGGIVDLIPRANYLIVDGERAILSTAYLGRQFDVKPIAAINMRGRAADYSVTDNQSKGNYEVKLKVVNQGTVSFSVYINISKSGTCTASISSLKIDNIRYSGFLVPIQENTNTVPETDAGKSI
jgi:hypothetical protein